MAYERASVFEYPQIAVESVYGTTPSTGYRQLQTLSIQPSVKTNVELFTAQGTKFPTVAAQGKEWTEAGVSGQPTFTEMIYPASGALGAATISTVGTAGKRWLWSSNQSSPDPAVSISVEQGSNAVRAGAYSYGLFTSLGFDFDRAKVGLKSSLIAQRYRDDHQRWLQMTGGPAGGTFTVTVLGQTTSSIAYNANAATFQAALEALSSVGSGNVLVLGGPASTSSTPFLIIFRAALRDTEIGDMTAASSLTGGTSPAISITRLCPVATSVPLVPITPGTVSVKVASAQSGLAGATALTRVLSGSWDIGNKYGPIWPVNSSYDSWAAHVDLVPKGSVKLKLAADSNGMSFLGNMRKGTKVFVEVKAVGDLLAGETSQYYTKQFQAAILIENISDFSDTDGLYAVEFDGAIAQDSTWGKAYELQLINLQAVL